MLAAGDFVIIFSLALFSTVHSVFHRYVVTSEPVDSSSCRHLYKILILDKHFGSLLLFNGRTLASIVDELEVHLV